MRTSPSPLSRASFWPKFGNTSGSDKRASVRTPPRILIVDDTPANVHILQARLAANGYDIVTATDGEEALAAVRDALPDLILLDVMMPKMDGFEVCRRLRADASLPFIPIILVTAKTDPKDIVTGLEAGGDEYLTKPVDRKSTRLNSSHIQKSRMPSSA